MTTRITDVQYTIYIDKLNEDDDYAIITTAPIEQQDQSDNNLGRYLNWLNLELLNSLTDPEEALSRITLVTSNEYNAQNLKFFDPIEDFIKSLSGRPISVIVNYTTTVVSNPSVSPEPVPTDSQSAQTFKTQNYKKTVYVGFIVNRPQKISASIGTQYSLECKPLIAQLGKISSNSSWNDATQTYDNAFTTVVANVLQFNEIQNIIYQKTLLDNLSLDVVNGSATPLPSKIWSYIIPSKTRLQIINELLIPYSRVFYQKEDGTLTIQPLFYDDVAATNFTIDAKANTNKNWLLINGVNNSVNLPNRVDVYFGFTPPAPIYGLENVPQDAFASAPMMTKDDKISNAKLANGLSYAEIYKTSARLYNSGKFCMPQMRTIDIDNGLLNNNDGILNALFSLYNADSLGNSVIRKSSAVEFNTIPLLYSQLYLSEINANAYNASVLYDYMQVINLENPLGKIVTINGTSFLDYEQNIVTDTVLSVNADTGSLFMIQTSPLLSITPAWYSANKG